MNTSKFDSFRQHKEFERLTSGHNFSQHLPRAKGELPLVREIQYRVWKKSLSTKLKFFQLCSIWLVYWLHLEHESIVVPVAGQFSKKANKRESSKGAVSLKVC